jgi:hypothetical protein
MLHGRSAHRGVGPVQRAPPADRAPAADRPHLQPSGRSSRPRACRVPAAPRRASQRSLRSCSSRTRHNGRGGHFPPLGAPDPDACRSRPEAPRQPAAPPVTVNHPGLAEVRGPRRKNSTNRSPTSSSQPVDGSSNVAAGDRPAACGSGEGPLRCVARSRRLCVDVGVGLLQRQRVCGRQ